VSHATFFHQVALTITTWVKDGLYHYQFPVDMFFPLVIEVFKFLHQQANEFFHQCANMVWGMKGDKSRPLSILCELDK
jgi:hypothetical protein